MSNEIINLEQDNSFKHDFRLRYISMSKYEGDWQSLPHTHQFSELFYVLSGKGVFYVEGKEIPVAPDDLIIINPHVEHTEKTLPNDPMEYIVFGVEGLAFSFSHPQGDDAKGYSFYSYGSIKKHFINFSQLMIKEFQEKKPGSRSAPGIISLYFQGAKCIRHLRFKLPAFERMCSRQALY